MEEVCRKVNSSVANDPGPQTWHCVEAQHLTGADKDLNLMCCPQAALAAKAWTILVQQRLTSRTCCSRRDSSTCCSLTTTLAIVAASRSPPLLVSSPEATGARA
mmetsp:Transcript_42594/g.76501  ORF Transcript_42594/g.76501 Transcript_42594/m.76501 type:complete len:104 (+) Transcript_42594:1391-1702(+)